MLSNQSVSTLVDMLENRISVMDVTDREDMRDLMVMKRCLTELTTIAGTPSVLTSLVGADYGMPRRGRRPKMRQSA